MSINPRLQTRLVWGLLLGASASIIWGGHAVVARMAVSGQGFHVADLLFCRYLPAALVLSPIVWRARAELARLGAWRLLLLTLTGGAPNLLTFVGGLTFAPASHGATIPPLTVSILAALLGWLWLSERPTPGRAAALAVMGAGIILIGWDGLTVGPGVWKGDLLLFMAGASWAAFTILLRRWQVAAVPAASAVTVISALFVLPVWLPWRAAQFAALPSGLILWMLIAQGVLLGSLSMLLFARSVEMLGATRTATLSVLVPVTGLTAAALVLGETIGPLKAIGATLAVGAMLAAVLFTGRRIG
ncbi:MAG: DMT family transporter [Acetobacteraceae bacterium]|nr:DMT family transporter [Acetobacteraceae bacterium]